MELDLARVGVVGSGRVGAVLAAALRRAGADVALAAGRSAASRARAHDLAPGAVVDAPAEAADGATLLLLAVPDRAVEDVARDLAPRLRPGTPVAHLSGRHGLAVLPGCAVPLALHPVLPFSGTAADLPRLAGLSWGVTARAEHAALADALVERLGGVPVHVAEERRALWHAALAHGANHLVTLVGAAADLLREAGAADPAAALRPLLEAALADALRDPDTALTGPVVRGDAETVGAHLAALPPDARPAYVALARATAERAVLSGRLDPQAQVLDLLARRRQHA